MRAHASRLVHHRESFETGDEVNSTVRFRGKLVDDLQLARGTCRRDGTRARLGKQHADLLEGP